MTAITRPNGKLYRPRKVTANAVVDEDEALCGVIVLGTHDVDRAARLAAEYARWQLGAGYTAAGPLAGWFREGYESGHLRWLDDSERGRAGVWFREIVEATP